MRLERQLMADGMISERPILNRRSFYEIEQEWFLTAADKLAALDIEDRVAFAALFDLVITRLGRADQVASEFAISEATLSRWRRGESAPHMYARAGVVERLRLIVLGRVDSNNLERDVA